MKIIILADGEGKRWGNYKGVPKQLLRIDGETLLDRMIRQFKEYEDDIIIIGSHKNKDATNDHFTSAQKRKLFLEIAEKYQEPFILLNGDCYYTDAIVKDCIERQVDRWAHWCCPHPNYYTGKPWGEGYIHKVVDLEWWTIKLKEYNHKVDHGLIQIGNDWSINRYLYGWRDLIKHSENIHDLSEYDVYWHDETDDFDFPVDYDRFLTWTKRR